jgi:Uma2 family endonuclease
MAVATRISPADFLAMTFIDRPEPELVDGEVLERAMPNALHSFICGVLVTLFRQRLSPNFVVMPEIRVQLDDTEFRTVDLAVFAAFPLLVPKDPPLVSVEILSPGDRYADVMRKCRDYERWGVPEVWLVNPEERSLHRYSGGSVEKRDSITLPALSLSLQAPEVFAGLPV